MKYVFTPSAKAFGQTQVQRTIDVEVRTYVDAIEVMLNGNILTIPVVAHAAAFGIKQMLANSYAQAGTAKDKKGKLLPESERLALWQGNFDKVLSKMTAADAARDWTDVFAEGGSSAESDPIGTEHNKLVRARLVKKAEQQGKKLPKQGSDEYKAMFARAKEKWTDLRAEAEQLVAMRDSIAADDIDFDFDGLEDEGEPESEVETNEGE